MEKAEEIDGSRDGIEFLSYLASCTLNGHIVIYLVTTEQIIAAFGKQNHIKSLSEATRSIYILQFNLHCGGLAEDIINSMLASQILR